jgi:hypothetical protein
MCERSKGIDFEKRQRHGEMKEKKDRAMIISGGGVLYTFAPCDSRHKGVL